MLYQLSYLGTSRVVTRERRFIVRLACPVHHASPTASRGTATPQAKRVRHSSKSGDGRIGRNSCKNATKRRSIRVFVIVLGGGNTVRIRQPAVQINIAAALGTKRTRGLGGRLAADRARLCRRLDGFLCGFLYGLLGRCFAPAGTRWWLSWHSTSRSESESLRRRATRSFHTAEDPRYWSRSRPS